MTPTTHSPSPRALRWLAWLPLAIALAFLLATLIAQLTVCAAANPGIGGWGWLPASLSTLGFAVLGGLIVTRQPHNRIGWLCGATAALLAPTLAASVYLLCAEQGLIHLPGLPYLIWLANKFSGLALSLGFLLLPLWFPDGRFLSAGWWRFTLIFYCLLILATLLSAFWPGKLSFFAGTAGYGMDNPFGLPFVPSPGLTRLVQAFHSLTLLAGILIANFSLFARWRRSDGQTRQQLKVVAFYAVTIGTVYMLFQLTTQLLNPDLSQLGSVWPYWLNMALLVLLWVGYPVAISVAVLKYRLYNIDLLIRRTLVYSTLSLLLGLIYFGGVTLFQAVFSVVSGQQSAAAIVISTLLIAALFGTLRQRVQELVDRRFYRRKYDAEQALASFAALAREEVDLEEISARLLEVVEETVQPEHASLWLKPADERRQRFNTDQESAGR